MKKGDALLYAPSGINGYMIAIKTWSDVSHMEIYDGNGYTLAARAEGVNRYKYDPNNLKYLLIPRVKLEFEKADEWFEKSAKGKSYDWFGLFAFYSVNLQKWRNEQMWCSEFATEYYRLCGMTLFNNYPSAGIAPSEYLKEDDFEIRKVD